MAGGQAGTSSLAGLQCNPEPLKADKAKSRRRVELNPAAASKH